MNVIEIDTKKKVKPQLKRVAGYARVSVDRAPSAESLKTQTSFLRKRIQSTAGWIDCGVFLDLGISGTRTDRPGFSSLMEKCEKKEIDLVITKSISRFCRNTVDLLSTVRHLKDLGIEVYFDENNISTFSTEGELLLTILASQAQEESRSISENVLWTIRKKFERGEGIPRELMGYRWTGKEYVIVEEEAEVVREIFRLYMTGIGPKQIANILNAKGVRGQTGKLMSESSITLILKQEKYKGDSIFQKTFTLDHISHAQVKNRGERDRFYVEGTHPPIIPAEEFDRVQDEMVRRSALGSVRCNWSINSSIFTSRIICCDCGRTFRRKNTPKKNGNVYYSWACGERIDKRYRGGCITKAIPEWALYKLTGEVLGKEDFSEEDFNASICHIIGGAYHQITFVMKDGERIVKTWENIKGGNRCQPA